MTLEDELIPLTQVSDEGRLIAEGNPGGVLWQSALSGVGSGSIFDGGGTSHTWDHDQSGAQGVIEPP